MGAVHDVPVEMMEKCLKSGWKRRFTVPIGIMHRERLRDGLHLEVVGEGRVGRTTFRATLAGIMLAV
jgi:hypothetical protein